MSAKISEKSPLGLTISRFLSPPDFRKKRLLDGNQSNTNFINSKQLQTLKRQLKSSGDPEPGGLEEAVSLANCAAFIRILYLPETAPRSSADQAFTQDVLTDYVPKLHDARQVFLTTLVPLDREIDDHVLSCLVDLTTQVHIFRLRRNVEGIGKEYSEQAALEMTEGDRKMLFKNDIVDTLNEASQSERELKKSDIAELKDRFDIFCNLRLAQIGDCVASSSTLDWKALAEKFPLHSASGKEKQDPPVASKLSNFILSVVGHMAEDVQDKSLAGYLEELEKSRLASSSQSSDSRKRGRESEDQYDSENDENEEERSSEVGRNASDAEDEDG